MTKRLLINGRFLGGENTAVNNVARALTDTLVQQSGDWQVDVIIPKNLQNAKVPPAWNLRVVGNRNGILWEQSDLPKLRTEGLIAGFFNTVPLRGRGYVTLLHDAHVFSTPGSFSAGTRLWRARLARRAGAAGNTVLTISEHAKQELLHYGIGTADQMGIVPNGPGPVTRVCPDVSILQRLGLKQTQPFFLGLSTLQPHKNINVLLRAFSDQRLADVKLVLFGPATRSTFEKAGESVPHNTVFAGKVRDAELASLYQHARGVCVPSTAEGFGLPALEAMTFGSPVIIAPCGALPEVVGDTGLSALPDDPTAWADAILRLANDGALHKSLSDAGARRASQFTWNAAGQAVLRHLDRWYAP